MPYLTTYRMDWYTPAGPTMDDVTAALRRSVRHTNSDSLQDFPETLWKQILNGHLPASWYNHQMDVATIISAKWPDTCFKLHGKGEDDDDIWVEYFQGGMVHRDTGQVVYPRFDPDKLTQPKPIDQH